MKLFVGRGNFSATIKPCDKNVKKFIKLNDKFWVNKTIKKLRHGLLTGLKNCPGKDSQLVIVPSRFWRWVCSRINMSY